MRCLLIGASGQLGRALFSVFAPDHEVIPTAHRHPQPGSLALDLADKERVRAILAETRSDLILVAGAMCAVDRCELEPEPCRRINVLGPRTVAEYAREHGSFVVYYSTDHVFDGTHDVYRETDAIAPLNAYARSKAEGETAVRELVPERHLVLRTSWLYGPDAQRMNFPLRCLDRIRVGERVLVPSDQWGSPTYTEDLARATWFLLDQGYTGTFHATGPDFVDRASLARKICARFGLDHRYLVPKPTSELGQAARRPLRVRLDCRKLREAGSGAFRGIDAGLDALGALEPTLLNR